MPPGKTATPPTPAAGTKAATKSGSAAKPAVPGETGPRRLNIPTGDTALVKPLVIMREVFTYDQIGRRDPFTSLLTTNDLRPTLSDLKLMGTVVDEPGRSVALVLDGYEKKQRSLRVGSRLGRMQVASIRANVVVFTINEFGMSRRDSLLLRDSTKVRGR